MPERDTMPKSLALIIFSLISAGCTKQPVDPIAAEIAETRAQVEAMKNHPSLVERDKKASGDPKAAQK
jgi:outer membrane murein-binding lipoprotein Lpp